MTTYSDFQSLAWHTERDACGVGFIADLYGRKTHKTLQQAITALCNLKHRGAVNADGLTGDGAGVLTQIPHKFFMRILAEHGIKIERGSDLGVGVFFVPNKEGERMYELVSEVIAASSLEPLLWRDVPVNKKSLGTHAKERLPIIRQVFIKRPDGLDDEAYERRLYLTRKRLEKRLREANLGRFYVPSFSSRTIVYKGLMLGEQIENFYPDLANPDYETAIALFHQRYSTNTMPRWSLAQPFRYLAHNGEINTLQGNVNFMRVREPVLSSKLWGPHVKELVPVIEAGGSDSAALDNAFELLMLSGRDPIHSIMMLVPEAFEDNENLDPEVRAFFEYHTALMEPWDGPAALAITDGRYAVAALDRNGLRPQRYWISKDGTIVVGSEAGTVPLPEEDIIEKGKLGPGQILAVDTKEQKLLKNSEIKKLYASKKPYRAWLEQHTIRPVEVKDELSERPWDKELLTRTQKAFGYSSEDYDRIFEDLAKSGDIPVGSMGDDTPLAVLSEQPQQLYRYFKQRFAQVTNPPIDPLRERMVMSLETIIGPRGSILEEDEASAAVMRFHSPIVSEAEFAWIKSQKHVSVATVNATFKTAKGPEGFEQALERLCYEAEMAVRDGAGVVIISDRAVDQNTAPLPILLATAAVHNKLLEVGLRTKTAMVLETGEPREDHHYACLISYGAGLIHPYLALATARDVPSTLKDNQGLSAEKAVKNYIKGVEKGLLKIMSKMGIAAIASYRAAKIFEAVGVDQAVIDHYFTGTPNRIGGATLKTFAIDTLRFHAEAFGETPELIDRGIYRFRKAGEYHALNPLVFKALHKAVRNEDFAAYEEYAKLVDERPAAYIRDLLDYRKAPIARDLEDVEPIEDIVKRFTTQAMSHGSVSRETHETLAIAMNRLGAKSNSGEGGEDEVRFKPYDKDHPELSHAAWHPKTGDWANSAIKQVASGRFGVTPEYLVSAQELEIKMAQGAKPGEGGQIPGHKVNDEIARIRRSVPGVTLISPPPHHDIYSIEDLAQLIYDLKRVNQKARITVKLVSTAGVGIIAAGVAKGYADSIQISGNDGGTGAAPLSAIKHAGLPWEIGLAETQQALVENDLRGRVTLRVDGGMKTGRDVMIGALLGAESFGFGTAALVAAGCAMIRQCHLNTCPVGVATQREDLRKKYTGEPEHVMRFMYYVAQQVRMILAEMGFRKLDDIIGRVDLLEPKTVKLPKESNMDLSFILRDPDESFTKARRSETLHNDRYEEDIALDETVWLDAFESIESKKPHYKSYDITNRERTVGARLSGEIARKHASKGLPAGTIQLSFTGVAGQSFGAFNNCGMHLTLTGEAQDYVGKGMYGGEIVLKPSANVKANAFDNVIIGNTVMYGATGGSLYASGLAGERLCVRNSGGKAVVEGCGDHGCEYMTGGVVLVLGKTGRNFAAGMSGGVAYVYDPEGVFATRYNPGMVVSERVTAGDDSIDEELIKAMLERHYKLTDSVRAKEILDDWNNTLGYFWKVAPHPGVEDKTAKEIDIHNYEVKALEALRQEASQVAVSFGD
jgi:glutamate synthase domain-containing protein 2/glutamate synthase domain-containing protein 1/glutamate synthase domain-containing protein 3